MSPSGVSPRLGSAEHRDYLHLNAILGETREEVKQWLATGLLGEIDRALGPLDDIVASFSVERARRRRRGARENALAGARRTRSHGGVSRRARLILDDFGTGYSSLSYLKRFPLDTIKIDRSFLVGLGTAGHDSAIVDAVLGMTHALGLVVVAEGIEEERQLRHLHERGAEVGQGYLFARPMAADAVWQLLAAPAGDAVRAVRPDAPIV